MNRHPQPTQPYDYLKLVNLPRCAARQLTYVSDALLVQCTMQPSVFLLSSMSDFIIIIIMRRRGRPQQSWRNQVTDFMRSRNMEEDMTEDRHLWRLGVDGRLLAV